MLERETTASIEKKRSKGYYAFLVCLAGFLSQFIVLAAQRVPGVSLELIREGMGLTYAEVALITSWFTIFYAGFGFVWGRMADRFGPRIALTASAALAAVGMILFGLFAHYGLIFAIVIWSIAGFGCAGLYMATLPKLVGKWFVPEKQGFAMSLITPGGNIASILIGLFIPTLIVNIGWEKGFLYIGIVVAVIALIIWLCARNDPADYGLEPWGAPKGTQAAPSIKPVEPEAANAHGDKAASQGDAVAPTKTKSAWLRVLGMKITWHYSIMYIIYQLGYMVFTTYFVAMIASIGFDTVQAGLSATFGGIGAIIFIFIWGPLSDKFERKNVIAVGTALCGIFTIIYYFVLQNSPDLWICYLFVFLLTGCIAVTPVFLSSAGDCFPIDIRGTGTGVISTLSIIGRYLGPWIVGILIDAGGGDVTISALFVGVTMIICAVIAMTLPKMKVMASRNAKSEVDAN
ncbi:nitrate/nitrite transporter [Adlercreutzia sp. ZJ154]|uniref:MFS transporter n=1 Tax=Adlercreutzia sp. ZJ154 TaxID=2709790 RepID=UPI0013ED702C|nr:MFS transporter [Adlercreutzia sp. ZJ154]